MGLPAQPALKEYLYLIYASYALPRPTKAQRGVYLVWQRIISSAALSALIHTFWILTGSASFALTLSLEPSAAAIKICRPSAKMTVIQFLIIGTILLESLALIITSPAEK